MMSKVILSSGIVTFPMPAAVISVGIGDKANLITLAYVGRVCSVPPVIAISIQPRRHSYKLIEEHGEFVLNYPTINQLREMDYCGTRSGRDVNKWEELKLTKEKGSIVQVPLIKEFPWNMECKVIKRTELGTHVCYFGEVVATHSDSQFVKSNRIDPDKFRSFVYISVLERHGFSLR